MKVKRYLFVLVIILLQYLGFSQNKASVQQIAKANSYKNKDVSYITNNLIKGLDDDRNKALVIFLWIANNISYDAQQKLSNQLKETRGTIIERTLQNRKGVCMHYAKLFQEMSIIAGLETHYITGYTKNEIGNINEDTHAWISVKIDGDFFMVDPTWGSGYNENGRFVKEVDMKYFCVPPQEFLKNHMPFDKMFQMMENPISHKSFLLQSLNDTLSSEYFNYKDSLNTYLALDELGKNENTLARISREQSIHVFVAKEMDYIKAEIDYLKYEKALDAVNTSIEAINALISKYNSSLKNKKEISENDLQKCKSVISDLLIADDELSNIASSNETILTLISELKLRVVELLKEMNHLEKFFSGE